MSNITNITSKFINLKDAFALNEYLRLHSDEDVATQIINSLWASEEDRVEIVSSVREFREAYLAEARRSHAEWSKIDHRKEKARFFFA